MSSEVSCFMYPLKEQRICKVFSYLSTQAWRAINALMGNFTLTFTRQTTVTTKSLPASFSLYLHYVFTLLGLCHLSVGEFSAFSSIFLYL